MSVLYSIYDALVSINVPNDKARAVVDAMEMDMLAKLATKSDLAHVQELLSKDIQSLTRKADESLASKAEVAALGSKLTATIYGAMVGAIALNGSILAVLIHFLR